MSARTIGLRLPQSLKAWLWRRGSLRGIPLFVGLFLFLPLIVSGWQVGAGTNSPPLYPSPNERFGVCVLWEPIQTIDNYPVEQLHAGWYVDFWTYENPAHPAGMEYVHLIRTGEQWYNSQTVTATLGPIIDANPGNLWLVGSEPDRVGIQDGRPPAEYAQIYHDLYYFIKRRDPTAQVAIGGIVQPTPLRLLYLDLVLQEYEARYGRKIPVDVWNIHNFILCETCGWGAGIPPGMEDYAYLGKQFSVQDNDDIDIFRQQIWDFRQWMADHGERDKPLIISEYGVLMPELFGFPYTRVRDFMLATFDFFLNTTDERLGYPADGNRLVQRWAWYSLNDYEYDPTTGIGFNGNLFDHDTAEMTPLGQDFANYTAGLVVPYVDLAVAGFEVSLQGDNARQVQTGTSTAIDSALGGLSAGPGLTAPAAAVTATLTVTVTNWGNTPAQSVTVQFYRGHPEQGGVPLGAPQVIADVPSRYAGTRTASLVWPSVPDGVHHLYVLVDADRTVVESNEANNLAWQSVAVNPRVRYFPLIPLAPR